MVSRQKDRGEAHQSGRASEGLFSNQRKKPGQQLRALLGAHRGCMCPRMSPRSTLSSRYSLAPHGMCTHLDAEIVADVEGRPEHGGVVPEAGAARAQPATHGTTPVWRGGGRERRKRGVTHTVTRKHPARRGWVKGEGTHQRQYRKPSTHVLASSTATSPPPPPTSSACPCGSTCASAIQTPHTRA